jgi:hypothetical protein
MLNQIRGRLYHRLDLRVEYQGIGQVGKLMQRPFDSKMVRGAIAEKMAMMTGFNLENKCHAPMDEQE